MNILYFEILKETYILVNVYVLHFARNMYILCVNYALKNPWPRFITRVPVTYTYTVEFESFESVATNSLSIVKHYYAQRFNMFYIFSWCSYSFSLFVKSFFRLGFVHIIVYIWFYSSYNVKYELNVYLTCWFTKLQIVISIAGITSIFGDRKVGGVGGR